MMIRTLLSDMRDIEKDQYNTAGLKNNLIKFITTVNIGFEL